MQISWVCMLLCWLCNDVELSILTSGFLDVNFLCFEQFGLIITNILKAKSNFTLFIYIPFQDIYE